MQMWENSQCTSGGAATLSQNGCVMAILRLSATLVVVSILSFPLGRAPPLGHGVARDRRGRGETGGKARTGGRDTEPCAHGWKRVHPHTNIPALALPDRPLQGPSYEMFMCGGLVPPWLRKLSWHLKLLPSLSSQTPRRPPRSSSD